jgi:hypothetical protein
MKAFRFLFWSLFHFASLAVAFGGSATLVSDSTNGLFGSFSRTANINLDSYNATSVTVSVSAWARYYSAFTASDSAVVNVSVQAGPANFYQGGGSEITLPVSATFTKSGGQWYYQGSPVGSGVSARGSVDLSNIGPETGVGDGSVTISVSWVDAPANAAPSISWTSAPSNVPHGQSYTVSAHGHDADGNLTQVNVWRGGAGFAFAGGGNGFDGDSGNSASDSGPQSITYTAQAVDSSGATSPTISHTVTIGAPPPVNRAPTISWTATPGTLASGQGYTVSAHGHDDDGNLTQVNVWRNGSGFAFAGGGNGTDGDSGNSATDSGPQTITYTAQAVDSNGATSATISQVVIISAPPPVNQAPTISWTATPGTVASGQAYSVSARGHDADGNLTQVNVWRNGSGFAFAGGGNGSDGDSGNSATDTGPQTITYTAQAVDSNGAMSATISQVVTISPPPPVNQAPTISWNSTPGTVASGQAYSVSAHGHDADGNLTQVNVWRNGVGFAFAGGGNGSDGDSGNSATDAGPQTITYTAQAVDSNGATSATISQVVTISAPPRVNQAPTISWNSTPGTVASGQAYSVSAHGHDADGNLTQVNVWRNGVGFAFAGGGNGSDGDSGNSATDSGPQSITYTAQAVDSSGATSATISQVVTISAPPPVNRAPSIAWNSTPGTVASGQAYSVSAHGHDADGNLTQVNVWRNGSAYAFAGGGNGTDGDSGNSSTDAGPQTITYTAQSVDSNGLTSATISQVVTISAPPPVNQAPTVAWNSTPGTVASGQSYTVSAHGHDPDGNLTQVNVWRDGVGFAFAGGGNGTDGDSGNSRADTGPASVTYTAQAVDSNGAVSATISQVVTISAPPPVNQAPTISWNTTPGPVASGQAYSISAHGHDADGNLAQVNVWRNGHPYAFAGGGSGFDGDSGNPSADVGPNTITYTAQAVDVLGAASPVISHTVVVNAPPPVNRAPSITWTATPGTVASGQSYSVSALGHDDDGNLVVVRVWKNGQPFATGAGNGTDGSAGDSGNDTGPLSVTFTAQATDADGATSPIIAQTVVVSTPPNRAPVVVLSSPGSQTVSAGTVLTLTSRATDADGNLIGHNLDILRPAGDWNFQGGFASGAPYQGGPLGSAGDSTRSAAFTFSDAGTYVVRAAANDGSGWVQSADVTISVVAVPPPNRAPTVTWISAPAAAAHFQNYFIQAHGTDADGNLIQVNVWKDGAPFAFAGGGDGSQGDSGNPTTDSGPKLITFTAQAFDGAGAASALITHVVTIGAPPPVLYTLTTTTTGGGSVSAGGTFVAGTPATVIATPAANFLFAGWTGDLAGTANPATVLMDADKAVQAVFVPVTVTLTTLATVGGSVSPGGTFPVGMAVAVTATADPAYDFVGWTVDLGGTSNPGSVVMNAAKTVRANFALKAFALSTSATAGGSVTAGGTYPLGVTVSISATPDAGHFFSGWSGDATGTGNPVAILMDRAKSVTALFTTKADQTITFATLGNRSVDDPDIVLTATASSGLPVTFTLVSGPATLTGNLLRITGPGAIAVTASQPGDALFNPAPDVTRALNAVAAPTVRYSDGRTTILSTANAKGGAHFIVERP